MGSKEYQHKTPGTPLKEWSKKRPAKGPNKTTTTRRLLKPGEKLPYGPGVPGRGQAR